jgi:hypothetical protein
LRTRGDERTKSKGILMNYAEASYSHRTLQIPFASLFPTMTLHP